jgi:hypothetical protein
MSRLIPFTAHVINNKILFEPKQEYIDCTKVKIVGQRRYKGLDANYCVVETDAFAVEYGGQILANSYFTEELFLQYLSEMCGCKEGCPHPDDNCFLLIMGCTATMNECGLLTVRYATSPSDTMQS